MMTWETLPLLYKFAIWFVGIWLSIAILAFIIHTISAFLKPKAKVRGQFFAIKYLWKVDLFIFWVLVFSHIRLVLRALAKYGAKIIIITAIILLFSTTFIAVLENTDIIFGVILSIVEGFRYMFGIDPFKFTESEATTFSDVTSYIILYSWIAMLLWNYISDDETKRFVKFAINKYWGKKPNEKEKEND